MGFKQLILVFISTASTKRQKLRSMHIDNGIAAGEVFNTRMLQDVLKPTNDLQELVETPSKIQELCLSSTSNDEMIQFSKLSLSRIV